MKKLMIKLLCVVFAFLFASTAYAQEAMEITDTVELPIRHNGSIFPQADGGFVISGRPFQSDPSGSLESILKIDADGQTVWQHLLLPEMQSYIYFFVPMRDDTYALLRECDDGREVIVMQNGEIVYTEMINAGNPAIWPNLMPAQDGFFIFYGERTEKDRHGGTFHVPVLEKRDQTGALQWRYVFDQDELSLRGVLPVEDGYLFFGSTEEQVTGKRKSEAIIVKMRNDGSLQWIARSSPKGQWKEYENAVRMPGGDILAVGSHTYMTNKKIGVNPAHGIIARISSTGELLWEKEFDWDIESFSFGAMVAVEQGYLIIGQEIDYCPPLHVLLVDENGETINKWTLRQPEAFFTGWVGLDTTGDTARILIEERSEDMSGAKLHVVPTGMKIVR